ncbi:hypothetical protein LINGRAPRIM_LOCUS1865 [Linum grandiflorum]
MSTVNEERNELDLQDEPGSESQKRSRLLYTREFLLSLSELDVCKRLPSGFDQSLLSEFEDTSQDRFRIPGGLSSQGYKRPEYGSSPPTRGDSSNFTRGIHGRWDNRSSVRSERDSDSQSELESDAGRRYGNQARRAIPPPEHDGLLGSGSFPRPPGFAAGSSTSKFRVNSDSHQLSRSNEPYHPPRPYKAVPHSRKETNDSFNDETFGSSESTDVDREEEERKRRDTFELLRKEQHKAFLERQKLNPGKGKDEFMSSLMEDPKDDNRSQGRSTPLDGPVSINDSQKSSISSTPVSRPLVPPGFVSGAADKSAGTKATTNTQLEQNDVKTEDTWISSDVHSSKFAQWFLEEEKNQVDNAPSGESNNLLSLIVGGEKGLPQAFGGKTTEHFLPDLSLQNGAFEDRDRRSSSDVVAAVDKPEEVPAVLTCEDLEQSILSEIPESGSSLPASEHGWKAGDQKAEEQKAKVDDHAAQHLLSLLQKGTSLNGVLPSSIHGARSLDKVPDVEEPRGASTRSTSASGKPLTLETLFGTAFMKELQPVGVPTSNENTKAGVTQVDGPDSHQIDAGMRNDVAASNQWQEIKPDRTEEHLGGFNSRRLGGFDASFPFGFQEEDNLSKGRSISNRIEGMATEDGTQVDIAQKLAALSSSVRDERLIPRGQQDGPPFGRSPYDIRELEVQYQNQRVRPSSQQLHAGSMFHQLDSHSHSPNLNAQMKFVSPENMIRRDGPNNPFPGNMIHPPFHQPNSTITGFDPSPPNALLQQMHMGGNFPPHMSHGFPRGVPGGGPHPNSQVPGFGPDGNSMHGFPFGQRQPNLGAFGIPPHGKLLCLYLILG